MPTDRVGTRTYGAGRADGPPRTCTSGQVVPTGRIGTRTSGQVGAMTPYAETPTLRLRQLLTDAGVLVALLLLVALGHTVHDAVQQLASPGVRLEGAGRSFAGSLTSAAGTVGDLPVVGDRLRAPFDGAAEALAAITLADLGLRSSAPATEHPPAAAR